MRGPANPPPPKHKKGYCQPKSTTTHIHYPGLVNLLERYNGTFVLSLVKMIPILIKLLVTILQLKLLLLLTYLGQNLSGG